MSTGLVFAFGVFGGVAIQSLDIRRFARVPAAGRGAWLTSRYYWGVFVVYALIGGVFAIAYDLNGSHVGSLLAINIGAFWPLLLERGGHAIPQDDERIS